MIYDLVKTLHLTAVLTFVGGLVLQSVCLWAVRTQGRIDQPLLKFVQQIYRWDRSVTNFALLITWGAGLYLGITGGHLSQPWMWAKLLVVTLLSGLHGVQGGALRRLSQQEPMQSDATGVSPYILIAAFLAIAWLVVIRPW